MSASSKGWAALTIDMWMLGAEASAVMWLRSFRLAGSEQAAKAEFERMVTEKYVATLTLPFALMGVGWSTSPIPMARQAVAHYRKPVRANRRRLTR